MLFGADDGSQLRRRRRPPLAQKSLFRLPIALERSLDPLERQALVLDSMDQRFGRDALQLDVGGLTTAAYQQGIAAGGNGFHRRLSWRVRVRYRLHLQIVRHNDAGEAELVPQDALNNFWRQRGGPFFVDRHHEYMRGHDEGHPRFYRRLERRELDRPQSVGRVFDDRQFEM